MKQKLLIYLIAISIGSFIPSFSIAQENTALACADGIDNDGNGLIDCDDPGCQALGNNGCLTCGVGSSFADVVLEYAPGCELVHPFPEAALGVSDYAGVVADLDKYVFLGEGGSIKLGFTNNVLTNSGDNAADLWVFEIGPAVEASQLALRPVDDFTLAQLLALQIPDGDEDGYFEFGTISGSTSSLDIDALMPGYAAGMLKFDAVEITDMPDAGCVGETPGADIDAVCALSSQPITQNINGSDISWDVRITPNPSAGNVLVRWTGEAGTIAEYEIMDAQGRMAGAGIIQNGAMLDLQSIAAGTYVLKLSSDRNIHVARLIRMDSPMY